MNNLNTDVAVEHIKTLVEKNRCVTCDELNGPIVRYPCGHTACKTCSETTEDCLLCLSPPTVSTSSLDTPSSERVKNASNLLNTFQELFNLDVYKRHRLSEQLKLEKQLFPKCIQAPTKYSNKRKSIKDLNDKENLRELFIAGENISNVSKMEHSISNVQQWLKNNESMSKKSNNKLPRKPFADLNVNEQSFTKDRLDSTVNNKGPYRKRKHLKIVDSNSDKKTRLLPKKKKTGLNRELRSTRHNTKINFNKKSENDESGIVVDETIIIDDSLTQCKDKDELALLAVKEAEKLEFSDFISFDESNHKDVTEIISASKPTVETNSFKVPFYKKSLLHNFCNECKVTKDTIQNVDNKNDFSVIIDSNKYITTIKVSQCPVTKVEVVNKQFVEIQTDTSIDETHKINTHFEKKDNINAHFNNNTEVEKSSVKVLSLLHSKDLKSAHISNEDVEISKEDRTDDNNLKTSKSVSNVTPLAKDKCIVIEESDTDSDANEMGSTIEVTAEVHREETHYVLSTLEPNEYETRMKRKTLRGRTPLSTDSSDKENYDPNRMKRQKLCKKNCSKK